MLTFSDFTVVIAGARPFFLVTDASMDGLGAVFEPRSTLPNKRTWSSCKLECAVIEWAVKRNHQLFYDIPFVVVSDYTNPSRTRRAWPLRSIESSDGLIF